MISPTSHLDHSLLVQLSKRKASSLDDDRGLTIRSSSSSSEDDLATSGRERKRQRLSCVRPPGLLFPKSLYDGWCPPQPKTKERVAIEELLRNHISSTQRPRDYQYVTLSDFHIYRPLNETWHPGTLGPLSDLLTRFGNPRFIFDGTLSVGSESRYVQGVPFSILSIDGYDDEIASVTDKIFIQSERFEGTNVWYKLASPAPHYKRYHDSFLWLADFTKHFVCYLLNHDNVKLSDFKSSFCRWVRKLHGRNPVFQNWYSKYNRDDFRIVVINNYEYLWKEATNVDATNRKHFLWKETDPKQLTAEKQFISPSDALTTVTPYVYNLFKHMYFGDQLEVMYPASKVSGESLNITAITAESTAHSMDTSNVRNIKIGDVVCLERDENGTWKDESTLWYAYVHDMEEDKHQDKILFVYWLYRPSETTCGNMRYPFENELFFSDHCNCIASKSAWVMASDVRGKLRVSYFSDSAGKGCTHFIRSMFVTENDENSFVTLKKSHLRCEHRSPEAAAPVIQFLPDDTVLVKGGLLLEPVVIVEVINAKTIKVRKLLRKRRDMHQGQALPNDLVYTQIIFSLPTTGIIRKCHVRCYTKKVVEQHAVPAPYCYGGVADCWIITATLENGRLTPLDGSFQCRLNQGFDPHEDLLSPLSTLDLFCGGGSFGRGIQDGGVAKVRWSVDIDEFAIHTKRANLSDKDDTALFFGSAVDYFVRASAGKYSDRIASPGTVHMIIAGSPCQGFSIMQQQKNSVRSKRNASMVALVIAFIDLYRPQYALLENVFGMTKKLGLNKDEDVFAQIVCAVVGMGYQVSYFIADAFSHGSPQNRSRIFISITAPGLTPISQPPSTHSTPVSIATRAIGRSLAGVQFGSRQFINTPFTFVNVVEATKDLPSIDDASVGCISFPDHRVSRLLNLKKKQLIQCIPRFPWGSGYVKANNAGRVPEALRKSLETSSEQWYLPSSKSYQRVPPTGLFNTISTACKPDDSRDGKSLHWDEQRMLTIMEARRAQSFPDHEVLIGLPGQQWKLVGNGVSRYVAAAFGMALRHAVLKNVPAAPGVRAWPALMVLPPVIAVTTVTAAPAVSALTALPALPAIPAKQTVVVLVTSHQRTPITGIVTPSAPIGGLHITNGQLDEDSSESSSEEEELLVVKNKPAEPTTVAGHTTTQLPYPVSKSMGALPNVLPGAKDRIVQHPKVNGLAAHNQPRPRPPAPAPSTSPSNSTSDPQPTSNPTAPPPTPRLSNGLLPHTLSPPSPLQPPPPASKPQQRGFFARFLSQRWEGTDANGEVTPEPLDPAREARGRGVEDAEAGMGMGMGSGLSLSFSGLE